MKRPPRIEPTLLHVDERLVVVNKPAGMLAVPGRGDVPCLQDVLRRMRPFAVDEPLRVVHRLDAEASGVMLFARTIEAQRDVIRQFAHGDVEKVYLALVSGYVAADGEVDVPITAMRNGPRMRVSRVGKASRTLYRVALRMPGHTLLECRPITGRTHQIRVHMAHIGHPLAVDSLYGGGAAILLSHYKPDYRPTRGEEERPLIARLTLHAHKLTIRDPCRGGASGDSGMSEEAKRITFEAPLPKDFRATLNQLCRL